MNLLREYIRCLLSEIIQGGFHDESKGTYTKTITAGRASTRKKEIQLYKDAIGQEYIRGVAKVYNVTDNEDGSVTIEMEHILPYSNSKGTYGDAIREPRWHAIQCIAAGKNCVDEYNKLSDEEYEMALGFYKDIKAAAKYFKTSGSRMDDNPGNYGFADRNGRLELVFLDFGQG
jgi:hypothetical protein